MQVQLLIEYLPNLTGWAIGKLVSSKRNQIFICEYFSYIHTSINLDEIENLKSAVGFDSIYSIHWNHKGVKWLLKRKL